MLSAFVSVAHAGHVTREKLETGRTVVRKGGKNLVKVENKHTFDQELVKTWQNAGKKAVLRRQVFLFWHIFKPFIQQLVKGR